MTSEEKRKLKKSKKRRGVIEAVRAAIKSAPGFIAGAVVAMQPFTSHIGYVPEWAIWAATVFGAGACAAAFGHAIVKVADKALSQEDKRLEGKERLLLEDHSSGESDEELDGEAEVSPGEGTQE